MERERVSEHTDREHRERLARARRARTAKVITALVVVGLFVAFIVANAEPTVIDFVFFERRPPLIWIMLACAVIGGAFGYLLGRPGRGFRFHRTEDEAPADRDGDG